MELKDIKIGMKVQAHEVFYCDAEGFVRPLDYGTVVEINPRGEKDYVLVSWDNPLDTSFGGVWRINYRNISPVLCLIDKLDKLKEMINQDSYDVDDANELIEDIRKEII